MRLVFLETITRYYKFVICFVFVRNPSACVGQISVDQSGPNLNLFHISSLKSQPETFHRSTGRKMIHSVSFRFPLFIFPGLRSWFIVYLGCYYLQGTCTLIFDYSQGNVPKREKF